MFCIFIIKMLQNHQHSLLLYIFNTQVAALTEWTLYWIDGLLPACVFLWASGQVVVLVQVQLKPYCQSIKNTLPSHTQPQLRHLSGAKTLQLLQHRECLEPLNMLMSLQVFQSCCFLTIFFQRHCDLFETCLIIKKHFQFSIVLLNTWLYMLTEFNTCTLLKSMFRAVKVCVS